MLMKSDIQTLLRPGFIIGLVVLVINDHILKTTFPGFITGKLSDVAGLFIFPLFILALGIRKPILIYSITTLGFVWWKSPLSESYIQFMNQATHFQIQRVVDYGDLLTLFILPVSYWYYKRPSIIRMKIHPATVVIITAFAFISTSQAPKRIAYRKTFSFQYPIDTLKHKIFFHPGIWNSQLAAWHRFDTLINQSDSPTKEKFQFRRDSVFRTFFKDTMTIHVEDTGRHYLTACIVPQKNRQLSLLHVLYLQHVYFDQPKAFEDSLIVIFEDKFIKPLYE